MRNALTARSLSRRISGVVVVISVVIAGRAI